MDFFEMKIFKIKWLQFIFFTFLISDLVIEGHAAYEPEYIVDDAVSNELRPNIISLDHVRQRRDAPSPPAAPTAASETKTEHTIVSSTTMSAASVSAAVTPVTTNITTPANVTGSPSPATTSNATDINRTTKLASKSLCFIYKSIYTSDVGEKTGTVYYLS
ncbi:unnamed protein product [Diatraea saccharalis]|uniref:Uncharacterized protein n=1 Tax=Diatraea saccharalis TaxID=40085 RepID=A0A9N9QKF4_9NEOP|nr:unnamed protein product [Diatraea saccharalis]